jgi:hypothetical protein
MPSLSGRIVRLTCAGCGLESFELSRSAFTAGDERVCVSCGNALKITGRFRKVVANPLIRLLKQLERNAIRPTQRHSLGLKPEVL